MLYRRRQSNKMARFDGSYPELIVSAADGIASTFKSLSGKASAYHDADGGEGR